MDNLVRVFNDRFSELKNDFFVHIDRSVLIIDAYHISKAVSQKKDRYDICFEETKMYVTDLEYNLTAEEAILYCINKLR